MSIPDAMEGKDLFVQAPTGSGKTLAYVLPILENLEIQGKGKHFPKALILVPTRELALQVSSVIRDVLFYTEGIRTAVLTGGTDIQAQIKSFSKGADIVIATPARLKDHLRRHTFKPKMCTTLVLDEADEMLMRGFAEDVMDIVSQLPPHQTLLYSATVNESVETFRQQLQNDPIHIRIDSSAVLHQNIKENLIMVKEEKKPDALCRILGSSQTIVFCNTVKTCTFVYSFLRKKGYSCAALYSAMEQKDRKNTVRSFRSQEIQILIATDIAARGMDIPSVEVVVNYDFPDQDASLIHRIGRTARANHTGTAYTFIRNQKEKEKYHHIMKNRPVY